MQAKNQKPFIILDENPMAKKKIVARILLAMTSTTIATGVINLALSLYVKGCGLMAGRAFTDTANEVAALNQTYSILIGVTINIIATLIVYYLCYADMTKPVRKYRGVFHYALLIPTGIATVYLFGVLNDLVKSNFSGFAIYADMGKYSGNMLWDLVSVAILPAIVSEFIYRGVLYNGLRRFFKYAPSILIAAIVSGFAGGESSQFIFTVIFGVMLGYVYERFGRIGAPILLHISANTLMVIAADWTTYQSFVSTQKGMICMVVGSVCVLAIAFKADFRRKAITIPPNRIWQ